jgi:phosphatidylglycerophosphatase A
MGISESLGKKRLTLKKKTSLGDFIAHFTAVGFGLGYLPAAPGTWASGATTLLAACIYYLGLESPFPLHVIIVILLFPVSWISSSIAARVEGKSDPNIVVIDEIFGQMLTLLLAYTITPWTLLIGFALFRFFDILKPFPVRQAERFPKGLGIIMDDFAAGLYAGACTFLLGLLIYGS